MTEATVKPVRLIGVAPHSEERATTYANGDIRLTVSLPYLKHEPLGQVSLTRAEVFRLIEECVFALRVTERDKP